MALAMAVPLAAGCGAHADTESADVGTAAEAVKGGTVTAPVSSCDLSVSSEVQRIGRKRFKAAVTVTNAGSTKAKDFSVLVNAAGATLVDVNHGTFDSSQYGYIVNSRPKAKIKPGDSYKFELKFEGEYTTLTTNVMSDDGAACDGTAPTIDLTASGDFFTSNGTLTLNAQASDDVAVGKVTFAQDGQTIATVLAPPYTVNVPVSNAVNGRHVYTATAYDLTGNAASDSQRVLVSIGNKFFGTAATTAADYTNLLAHFNQVTPGNAGKWGSVEAVRGQMNWTDLDTAYNFAKSNHLPFKLHTLVWGSQQPAWVDSLSPADQLAAIDNWMSALAARYPSIDLIDVVNEPMHTPPSYAAALGGAGATGWDWVITAFQMARDHFPNSDLLMNDYSVLPLASFTQEYLTIINLLKDRGLIDGVAEQGHFYERSPDPSVVATNLGSLAATGLPLYISELDLNLANDARQAQRMSQIFPIFWSNPSVVGITHWGYLQGNMWQPDAYLIRSDGSLRPSLTWLECYKAGGTSCPVPTYVPQPRTGDSGGIKLQAPDYDDANGLLALGNVVAYANDGSWLSYNQVSFDSNWNKLAVTYALGSTSPISLSISLGSLSNAPVATVPLAPTGSWGTTQTVTIPWPTVSTTQDMYVRFNGGGANLQTFQFTGPAAARNLVSNGTFESGASGWFTFNGGSLSATSARAHGGTQSVLVTNRGSNAPAATDLTSVVTPGTNYPFSLWVSINSPSGANQSINVTQAASCKAANGTVSTTYSWVGGPISVPNGATWTQFTGTVAVPNCTLTQLLFWVEGGAGTDLYVDDVQVLDTSGAPANLITDGTFESGQGSWFSWGSTSLGVTTVSAHTGTHSLLGSGMSNGAVARDIKSLVAPGKRYQATAWVSVGNLAAGSGGVNWQTVQNCNGAASDSYPWLNGATVANGSWVKVSGVVDLTSCTSVGKLLLFAGVGSGDVYLDDVSLTPLP